MHGVTMKYTWVYYLYWGMIGTYMYGIIQLYYWWYHPTYHYFFWVVQYLERTWPLHWGTLLFYVCWTLTGRTRGLWSFGASGINGGLSCLRKLTLSSSHLRQNQIFHVCFSTLHLNVTAVCTESLVDINWSASTTLPGDVSSCTVHHACQTCGPLQAHLRLAQRIL